MSKDCVYNDGNPAHARGMCNSHYQKWVRGVALPKSDIVVADTPNITLVNSIRALLLKTSAPVTVEALSDKFDVGVKRVRLALSELSRAGLNVNVGDQVELARDLPAIRETTRIDTSKFKGEILKFGLTSDNHLCSKYARADVLNAMFDIWERHGITRVLQAGNMIDGEARFNRFDLVTRPGIDAQAEFLVNEWPYRKGITTEFVCGDDHEGWYVQREGINIVQYLQNAADKGGRSDMKFVGYMEHDYVLAGSKSGGSIMRVIHAGGGSAYATSYTVQKIVESYQPNEKPTILIAGHFHKFEMGYPRAVIAIQPGCTQDQTPFLRKKRIEAMIGACTVSFTVDPQGIVHDFNLAWEAFYDRGFYGKEWRYK